MSDLVKELRNHFESFGGYDDGAEWHPEICDRAADEIVRLRGALSEASTGSVSARIESLRADVMQAEQQRDEAVSYAVLAHEALLIARRVLVRWEELYAEWSNANGHMALLFDRRLPPADHVKALEAIYAALAKNPNHSGHLTTEASLPVSEASGPVWLGPDAPQTVCGTAIAMEAAKAGNEIGGFSRAYLNDALSEMDRIYEERGPESALVFIRIACGEPGKITDVDLEWAREAIEKVHSQGGDK